MNGRGFWSNLWGAIGDFFSELWDIWIIILYFLGIVVSVCLVSGMIILFIWIGTGLGYEDTVANFINNSQHTLMQEYFKGFNVGNTKYYTSGYLSTLINDYIEKNHYFTNPWFGYYWSVNDLYVNTQTHTMTFNLYDSAWESTYSINWTIPSNI